MYSLCAYVCMCVRKTFLFRAVNTIDTWNFSFLNTCETITDKIQIRGDFLNCEIRF